MAKNIAIVGSKPDSWEKCKDLDRRSWEIWRFSRKNFEKDPKPTKWFELHHPSNYVRYERGKPGYELYLNQKHCVLWGDFPFAELIEEFSPFFFHGGQASWILAYAITKKPKKIMLFGIEPDNDYGSQRKEIQHFMCIATERGIEVEAPDAEGLMQFDRLYAVEKDWNGQERILAKLRAHGVEESKLQDLQPSLRADKPREDCIAEMKAKAKARKAKYGAESLH